MKITVLPISDHSQLHCAMTLSRTELRYMALAIRELESQVAEEQAISEAFPPPEDYEPKMCASRITGTDLPYTISLCMSPREKSRPPLSF